MLVLISIFIVEYHQYECFNIEPVSTFSMAFTSWAGVQDLVILGSSTAPRLAIFSFMIRHAQSKLFLHYNYVAALLNDLFGIQTRGGCACAGPYAQVMVDGRGVCGGLYAQVKGDGGRGWWALCTGKGRLEGRGGGVVGFMHR